MVLRKITIDNSVKYVQISEKDIEQNTTKNKNQSVKFSEGGKLNKKFSKNNKKFVKEFTAGGFGILK